MIDQLIQSIDAYCKKHKMGVTRFGLLAVGSLSFYARLKKSRNIKVQTIEKVEAFMRKPPLKGRL